MLKNVYYKNEEVDISMILWVQNVINNKVDEFLINEYRGHFKLNNNDIEYIKSNGILSIKYEALDIIKKRIASDYIFFDGMQTPLSGNPIYVAQHATGTCCRKCLYECHGIVMNKRLSKSEINYIVLIIMTWIEREYNKKL